MKRPLISVVIPVFNEEKTIQKVLWQVLAEFKKLKLGSIEVIVVDDGSKDNTSHILSSIQNPIVHIITSAKNRGKGHAVRLGLKKSRGQILLIQDADLEYHPRYYQSLLKPILNHEVKVVYGSRLGHIPVNVKTLGKIKLPLHFIANKVLSWLTSVLYGQVITDMETCYKVFSRNVYDKLELVSNGFEIETELTAKILKAGFRIKEVPISTNPRDYSEGKKITYKDGFKAVYFLFKYRLNLFHLLVVSIVFVAIFTRFWNFSNRYGLWSDQARDVLVARVANQLGKPPLIGSFSSAGPFTFGPIWYHYAMLADLFPGGHMNYWIGVGLMSVAMVIGVMWLSYKNIGGFAALVSGTLAAVSVASIESSLSSTQHSLVAITTTVMMVAMYQYAVRKNVMWALFVGLFFSLTMSAHYQTIYLFPMLVVFILIFRLTIKHLAVLLLGISIPLLPLLVFDIQHKGWNWTKLIDYYQFGQYRVYVPNRWLTYVGVFWPQFWARVVGGWQLLAYLIMPLTAFLVIKETLSKKLPRILIVYFSGFLLGFIWFRYFRAERNYGYTIFSLPFIFLSTGWTLNWLYHRAKSIALLLTGLLVIGSLIQTKQSFMQTNSYTNTNQLMSKLQQVKPSVGYTIYDQNFGTTGCSIVLSLLLDDKGLASDQGFPVGVCDATICANSYPTLASKEVGNFSCKLVDISSLSAKEKQKQNWVSVSPKEVHRMTVDWWKTEPALVN